MASRSKDFTNIICNLDQGNVIRRLTGHTDGVNSLAVLKNGHLVSGSHNKTIRICDIHDGSVEKTLNSYDFFYSGFAKWFFLLAGRGTKLFEFGTQTT